MARVNTNTQRAQDIQIFADAATSGARTHFVNTGGGRRVRTLTAWFDLLAFTRDLERVNWQEESPETEQAFLRVAGLHEAALKLRRVEFETVQANDAAIFSIDLLGGENVGNFLNMLDFFYDVARTVDKNLNGPGIRGVVALGNRLALRANYAWPTNDTSVEALRFVCPRAIMMNTGFGRA
jgi:hypothetical protein